VWVTENHCRHRQEPSGFEKPFVGVVFTEQDKEQSLKTGHGRCVFDLF
jgi:hypothetical protein